MCITVCKRSAAYGKEMPHVTKPRRSEIIISNYIKKQREHHKTQSFKEEYVTFLKEMGLELDERDWNR